MLNTNSKNQWCNGKEALQFLWADMCQDYLHLTSLRKELAMAGLIKRRETWYARIRWYEAGLRKEKQIPLKTKHQVTARERLSIVNKVATDIQSGISFTFPWMHDENETTVKRFTLKDAASKWIEKRTKGSYRKNTLTINKTSLHYLSLAIGGSRALRSIDVDDIERFIDFLRAKGSSDTTINIHLRTIKAMLRYYLRSGRITAIPYIEQVPIAKTDPIYITDSEFQMVMQLDTLANFYKRVFLLYRETGMRLREPMIARLNGDWIDIPPESKTHHARSIEPHEPIKQIFIELKDWLDHGYGSSLQNAGDHISKKFKKALRLVGVSESKHFHSLRHTYAVRSLLLGVSIYDVKLLMGHRSVTTTEVYSEMNLKRVAQDFPSLKANKESLSIIGIGDTHLGDTKGYMSSFIDERRAN